MGLENLLAWRLIIFFWHLCPRNYHGVHVNTMTGKLKRVNAVQQTFALYSASSFCVLLKRRTA